MGGRGLGGTDDAHRTGREIVNRDAILELIAEEKNPDRREQAIRQQFSKEYAYIRSVIYPQLRAVNFRYNLRRKGMVKDTIHTTELDTAYARGVELLRKRKYAKALYILGTTTTTATRSWRICRWIITSGRWSCWQRCPRMP